MSFIFGKYRLKPKIIARTTRKNRLLSPFSSKVDLILFAPNCHNLVVHASAKKFMISDREKIAALQFHIEQIVEEMKIINLNNPKLSAEEYLDEKTRLQN